MSERPHLKRTLDGNTFRTSYYLKEELVAICREWGLPTSGGKLEITDRITHFLDTGEVLLPTVAKAKATASAEVIGEDTLIEPNFVCSEKHRVFFREKIGRGFFFNVAFQKWLKSHTGATYAEAIDAYHQILKEKNRARPA